MGELTSLMLGRGSAGCLDSSPLGLSRLLLGTSPPNLLPGQPRRPSFRLLLLLLDEGGETSEPEPALWSRPSRGLFG